ncbi:hypothetical protein FE782_01520 [Paenibacillus antri]|uniref:Uncharacterized protein n=1 Tax=Paenibacillus antri TaxID=2582848 RepID=A0A5R9GKE9_9BACL|nr:hypothetical protein [Paenibacillus antri]TLS54054.1 hypothetical protein FE782_01520 [Paenibacillus antri]
MKKVLLFLTMLALMGVGYGCTGVGNATSPPQPSETPAEEQAPQDDATDTTDADAGDGTYRNADYGFDFALPDSWKGYTIVVDEWEGTTLEATESSGTKGPLLSIRHPEWTAEAPRQDIPIMIFTTEQWDRIQDDELHVGAAPSGPSELGRNSKYVFALPARYNYAFPTGYEEVESILADHPLTATEDFQD